MARRNQPIPGLHREGQGHDGIQGAMREKEGLGHPGRTRRWDRVEGGQSNQSAQSRPGRPAPGQRHGPSLRKTAHQDVLPPDTLFLLGLDPGFERSAARLESPPVQLHAGGDCVEIEPGPGGPETVQADRTDGCIGQDPAALREVQGLGQGGEIPPIGPETVEQNDAGPRWIPGREDETHPDDRPESLPPRADSLHCPIDFLQSPMPMTQKPEPSTGPLAGKTALVTGSSRGIGRAIAERLARAGARIAVHYHTRAEDARATATALAGSGHRLFPADLGQAEERRRLVRSVLSDMGGPHILVNNAGLYRLTPLLESPETVWLKDFEDLLNVNLIAPAHLAFLCARAMVEGGIHGRIINIGSRGAFRGEPEAPGYGAAKSGLHALTQSLALALGPHHIAVTAIAPGWVGTDMAKAHLEGPRGPSLLAQSPLGRVARPEEVAALTLYLAGEEAEYATGAVIDLNGASYLR